MIKAANLALRFLLELCALVSVGYWGFHTHQGFWAKIGLGLGAPLAMAIVWAIFGSPKAAIPLNPSLHLLLELIVFGLPAVALFTAGKPRLAALYLLAAVINRILMYIWEQ